MSENTQLTTQGANAVAPTASYVANLLENLKQDFLAVNVGMDLDYVRMGKWLTIDKKGRFQEKASQEGTESIVYGDEIDVILASGEQRWMIWGARDTDDNGMVIATGKTREECEESLNAYLETNPDKAERYSAENIALRYMAVGVIIENLQKAQAEDDFPTIYMIPMATTNTFAFGNYTKDLYDGKYKAMGIPRRTAVRDVVTRLTTSEKKGKGTDTFVGIDFTAVALFNPAEYGITE
jgi:hypothetical protein